jgi:hypothetical protein
LDCLLVQRVVSCWIAVSTGWDEMDWMDLIGFDGLFFWCPCWAMDCPAPAGAGGMAGLAGFRFTSWIIREKVGMKIETRRVKQNGGLFRRNAASY